MNIANWMRISSVAVLPLVWGACSVETDVAGDDPADVGASAVDAESTAEAVSGPELAPETVATGPSSWVKTQSAIKCSSVAWASTCSYANPEGHACSAVGVCKRQITGTSKCNVFACIPRSAQ